MLNLNYIYFDKVGFNLNEIYCVWLIEVKIILFFLFGSREGKRHFNGGRENATPLYDFM